MYRTQSILTSDNQVPSYEKRLSICLRSNGFSFSVVTVQGTLLTIGNAVLEGGSAASITEHARWIKDYFSSLDIPAMGLQRAELVVPSRYVTWIPEHLYTPGSERKYFSLLTALPVSAGVCADLQPALKSYAVFAADSMMVGAFKIAFTGLRVCCQHSKMANAQLLDGSRQHPIMRLHWDGRQADVNAADRGALLLSNSYTYATQDELLYSLIGIMKQLAIESPSLELQICGQVDRALYGLFSQYFPKVTLYNGMPLQFANPEMRRFHTYKEALILS